VRPFADRQIELLQNFAAQAVIAIENTRLLNELRESLQQQTATADVLKVISRSTFDLRTVLDTLVESAARLCDADKAFVFRHEGIGYRLAANFGFSREFKEYLERHLIEPGRNTLVGRTTLERRTIHIPDVLADPEYTWSEAIERGGFRTMLGVPLLRGGVPVGVFQMSRVTVRPFTDKQIELMTTFADQALIAIENVRLFDEVQARTRELGEALEQQVATSEVLGVISSSPGELDTVFNAMLSNALRICEATFGHLFLYEGELFREVSHVNTPPGFEAFLQRGPVAPAPGTGLARIVSTKEAAHIDDIRKLEAYANRDPFVVAGVEEAGIRTLLIVPMLKDNELIGVIGIYRQEVRPFSEKQVELVKNFAAQAVIAIENTRLLNELRQRTDDLSEALERQTATSDVLQVISTSPGDLKPVFETMLESATRICGAKFGMLNLYNGDSFRTVAFHNMPPGYIEARSRPFRPHPESGLGYVERTNQVAHIEDIRVRRPYFEGDPVVVALADLAGARTLLIVPMLKENELVGTIGIFRQEVRRFGDKQIELVTNFARQAVIAIENTRLLNELRESLQQQTATAEVLQIISRSPGALEPVFEAMLANAVRICEAKFGVLSLFEGNEPRAVAMHGAPREFEELRKRDPKLPMVVRSRLQSKQVVHLPTSRPKSPMRTPHSSSSLEHARLSAFQCSRRVR